MSIMLAMILFAPSFAQTYEPLQVCAKKISDDSSIINENQKKRIISETQSAAYVNFCTAYNFC